MPHRNRLFPSLSAAAAVALVLGLTACSSSNDGNRAETNGKKASVGAVGNGLINTQAEATPVKGGTLVVADYTEARSMDPTKTLPNGGGGGSALLAVYDSLVTFNDATQKYEPQLAKSLRANPDNTEWTLDLRPDVKFTDGTPVDADAVMGSIERFVKAHGVGSMQWNLLGTRMRKVDEDTVTFTTAKPWARLDNMLATGPGMILAPAAYADPKAFTPIGAGPFTFVSYKPTESLTLKANPDYYGGAPHLDGLKFVWPLGDQTKWEALESGDVDTTLIRTRVPVDAAIDAQLPAMRWQVGQGRAIFVNRREGRDAALREVRDALNLAFDPVELARVIREDPALATKSLFPADSPWNTGVEPVARDLEAARAKVKEAKAKGFDGTVELLYQGDASSQNSAVAVKAQLEAGGFKVTLKAATSIADLVQAMYVTHDYDMAFSSVGIRDGDPSLRMTSTMHSTAPENTWGLNNPELDGLLVELAGADSPADGLETMRKIETIWQQDPPVLGMTTSTWLQPWAKNVHGLTPTAEMLLRYDKAWKEQ